MNGKTITDIDKHWQKHQKPSFALANIGFSQVVKAKF